MGVYIKGMEMPTKGYRLILIHADGTVQSTDGETTAVPVWLPNDPCGQEEEEAETIIEAEEGDEETEQREC